MATNKMLALGGLLFIFLALGGCFLYFGSWGKCQNMEYGAEVPKGAKKGIFWHLSLFSSFGKWLEGVFHFHAKCHARIPTAYSGRKAQGNCRIFDCICL